MDDRTIAGRCLCGNVTFQYAMPSLWSAHCHCTLCQRAHGAAYVTWVGAHLHGFELIREDSLSWYESTPGARRGFCNQCGSTLFFESTQWPGEMHISRANLPARIDIEPQRHVHFEDHAAWIDSAERLPRR